MTSSPERWREAISQQAAGHDKATTYPSLHISPLFNIKKAKILEALSIPSEEYNDLSPKGSVDEGIRDLISSVNALDGIATTSSCAGRISVFLEGKKSLVDKHAEAEETRKTAKAVPGGKGLGGRWLYVSHDPVLPDVLPDLQLSNRKGMLYELFQMKPEPDKSGSVYSFTDTQEARFVKFQFEPMILHVMTASLHHAQKVLSAALEAGFRESGVQSLKALDDPNAFPMVAVRSAGLALSSIIGVINGNDEIANTATAMVSEEYLRTLLILGNERFRSNAARIDRFRTNLLESGNGEMKAWEDKKMRAERKRVEGLQERAKRREPGHLQQLSPDVTPNDTSLEGLNGMRL